MNHYFKFLSVTLAFIFIFGVNAKASSLVNPIDEGKEMLFDLLTTGGDEKFNKDIISLKNDVGLTDEQIDKIRDISINLHNKISKLMYETTDDKLDSNDETYSIANFFNSTSDNWFNDYKIELKNYLGDEQYNNLMDWITIWWKDEVLYRQNPANSPKVETYADMQM